MEYKIITNKTYSTLITENSHNISYNQENVQIFGIPESYTSKENTLTDKGVLIINCGDDTNKNVHVYDLFNVNTNKTFDDINIGQSNLTMNNISPDLENVHGLLLQKDSENNYYAIPQKLTSKLFRLDIDSIKVGNTVISQNEDGFFESETSIVISQNEDGFFESETSIDKIYVFGIPMQHHIYFNADGETSVSISSADDSSAIVQQGTSEYYYVYDSKSSTARIDPIKNKTEDFLYFKISGDDDSPDSIYVEVC